MASFYIKYTPARRGLTGAEYLPQWLDENYSSVTFTGVASDGVVQYGILEGSGDDLSQVLALTAGKFSMIRLTEEEFIGNCNNNYNPQPDIDGETPPTFVQYMANFGITVTDLLGPAKAARLNLFKEISKKKCMDDNDSIADLAKCVTLLTLHYDDLSTSDKATVDGYAATLKNMYSQAVCIDAFDKMVNTTLANILASYYTAKTSVENATTVEEVNNVVYN